ncbi:ankyrin repeat and SOCS box protein 2b isoform X1 [Synchiropus splendidus]|uniref:ankyrin repeat and SOCS box protein 2b isoform X1 n=1 Tax=Synchiropus splendidus TaxID=270530 RepID=UPI00237DF8A6|nr:ankyrin repeat and SOCS box protein 2b isoform X1 [Synchiropus splendidus]
MTKFSYSEYLSQFRNAGNKCGQTESRLRDDDGGGEDGDPAVAAVRSGDLAAVQRLLPHRLTRENKDGWILLHDAAFCGQSECLKSLLAAQPSSVDKRTLQEQTPLLLAVSCGHLSCARVLLEAGADPDISNKNKETPLYKACASENADMVDLLLSFGASVNQRCCQGWTALHEAVSRNNTEICEVLIRGGADVNPANTYSVTPLITAARRGHMGALKYLIGKGADVNLQTCDGVTALHEAAKHGHQEVVAELLRNNADANTATDGGFLPLHVAAQHGHHQIVSQLVPVTSRTRLRHSCVTPLHLAAEHDSRTAAAVLLKTGSDVNVSLAHHSSLQYTDRRRTPLSFAAANGNAEMVDLLLDAGALLTLDPVSPLLLAVRRGCLRTVTRLLEREADVNVRVLTHNTTFPAAIALCADNPPLLQRLLAYSCDARSCFTCRYGTKPHPEKGHENPHNILPPNTSRSTDEPTQFCEWISSPAVSKRAGPVLDLLLDHVDQVQPCSRLTQVLSAREDWAAVLNKTTSPRPLLHLSRITVRRQVGRHRRLLSLPLPDRLIRYLTFSDLQSDTDVTDANSSFFF